MYHGHKSLKKKNTICTEIHILKTLVCNGSNICCWKIIVNTCPISMINGNVDNFNP